MKEGKSVCWHMVIMKLAWIILRSSMTVCISPFQQGSLHRNFMGYTSSKTKVMIGLGLSSISDSWYSFAQNEKTLEDYYARLEQNEIPVFKRAYPVTGRFNHSSAYFELNVYL